MSLETSLFAAFVVLAVLLVVKAATGKKKSASMENLPAVAAPSWAMGNLPEFAQDEFHEGLVQAAKASYPRELKEKMKEDEYPSAFKCKGPLGSDGIFTTDPAAINGVFGDTVSVALGLASSKRSPTLTTFVNWFTVLLWQVPARNYSHSPLCRRGTGHSHR